jgi:hypothetical protein
MEKGERLQVEGKKRASDTKTPIANGEIVKTTKDSIWILWDGSNHPIEIPKEKVKQRGKLHKIERN